MSIHHLVPELLTREVRVTVIGAGGSGSQMLMGLAQLHTAMLALGHPGGLDVTVVDADQVSEANVGRQMFYPSDVGLSKASVLVNRINMAMGTGWKAQMRRLTAGESLRPIWRLVVWTIVWRAKQSWNRWDVLAAGIGWIWATACMMVRSFSVSCRRVGPSPM